MTDNEQESFQNFESERKFCPICFAEIPPEILWAAEEENELSDEDEYSDMIICPECLSEVLPIDYDEFEGGGAN
jgi:hypothetical protein